MTCIMYLAFGCIWAGNRCARGKEEIPCEQFVQGFEIHRTCLCAKKRGKIQNPIKITHKAKLVRS